MDFINYGQWWWLLVPLGTGICALLGSWLGATLSRLAEHKQWNRNKKQEAYEDFLSKVKLTAHDVQAMLTTDLSEAALVDDMKRFEAYQQLELVANTPVSIQANGLINDVKLFRVVIMEAQSSAQRALERLANPKEGDSDSYKEVLGKTVRDYRDHVFDDLVSGATTEVFSRMRAVVAEMRKDLGMPQHTSDEEPDSLLTQVRDSQRRMWSELDLGTEEEPRSPFERSEDEIAQILKSLKTVAQ